MQSSISYLFEKDPEILSIYIKISLSKLFSLGYEHSLVSIEESIDIFFYI